MRFFKIFILFFLAVFSLHSAERVPALISCIEGVPEAKIAQHIDAISGQFVDVEVDLFLHGPDPLVLQRNYESSDFALGENPGSWRLLSHCFLVAGEDVECLDDETSHVQQHAYVGERLGSFLCYSGWRNVQKPDSCILRILNKNQATGLTNCARGEMGARTFGRNNQIIYRQQDDCYEFLSMEYYRMVQTW